ncbi:MAG: hypothetical protein LBD05_02310, partial [Mycoplasmataceae bacterium]|nr:hypothetical protein [Mycoplasmataceae bacterium]
KLKLIKLKNINFIFCLIKREFLLWGILYFAYLIIGIVLLFNNVNDASNIISSILLTNKIDSNIIYLIIFYKIINTFTFFFILIILINSIYNGSNQNILDKLSLATIISDKQKKRKKTVQNIEVKYDLPGSDLNLKELFDDE